jgi:hypothetical protein
VCLARRLHLGIDLIQRKPIEALLFRAVPKKPGANRGGRRYDGADADRLIILGDGASRKGFDSRLLVGRKVFGFVGHAPNQPFAIVGQTRFVVNQDSSRQKQGAQNERFGERTQIPSAIAPVPWASCANS